MSCISLSIWTFCVHYWSLGMALIRLLINSLLILDTMILWPVHQSEIGHGLTIRGEEFKQDRLHLY